MAITCEVHVAVCFVLAHICTSVASVHPYRTGAVLPIFAMWQPYVFSDVGQYHEM